VRASDFDLDFRLSTVSAGLDVDHAAWTDWNTHHVLGTKGRRPPTESRLERRSRTWGGCNALGGLQLRTISSATITVAIKRKAAVISQAGNAILSWHREDGTVSLRITLLEDLV
jgi:hypothetical protein